MTFYFVEYIRTTRLFELSSDFVDLIRLKRPNTEIKKFPQHEQNVQNSFLKWKTFHSRNDALSFKKPSKLLTSHSRADTIQEDIKRHFAKTLFFIIVQNENNTFHQAAINY